MSLKRILVTGLLIAGAIATVIANLAQPAVADGLSQEEAAIVVGIGSVIPGAATSGPQHPFHHNHPSYAAIYDGERAREAHVARCAAHYRSYDERTDTYVGFDGGQHFCVK